MRFCQATRRLINVFRFIRTIDPPFADLKTGELAEVPRALINRMICDALHEREHISCLNRWTLRFEDAHMGYLYYHQAQAVAVRCLRMAAYQVVAFIILTCAFAWLTHSTLFPGAGRLFPVGREVPWRDSLLDRYLPQHQDDLMESSINQTAKISTSTSIMSASFDELKLNSTSDERRLDETTACLLMAQYLLIFLAIFLVHWHSKELNRRRDFIWHYKALDDKERMAKTRGCNKFIFFNLLPPHVASWLFEKKQLGHMDLYYHSYNSVGIIFATVCNFSDFYSEVQDNNHGLDCLQLLNEIISDFDLMLDQERFKSIDKIKTIGATYMAALGLCPSHELPIVDRNSSSTNTKAGTPPSSMEISQAGGGGQQAAPSGSCQELAKHLLVLLKFVSGMRQCLDDINKHSHNNFMLRVGMNLGPATAGVIGATKPHYDIWGNTVNVASRMESTCEPNYIQITKDVYEILRHEPMLKFTCRGEIDVKGKGRLTTYYVEVD